MPNFPKQLHNSWFFFFLLFFIIIIMIMIIPLTFIPIDEVSCSC